MNSTTVSSGRNTNILRDVFNFLLIPIRPSINNSEYEVIGVSGSVKRLVGLVIANSIVMIIGLVFFAMAFGNTFTDLGGALGYIPFDSALILLIFTSFFVHTTAYFLCFRLVSGKGNLVPHSYLSALSSSWAVMLFWLSNIISLIPILGILVFIIGTLYLLVPSLISLKVIHRLSWGRAIIGFVLSSVASIPLFLLFLLVFSFFREAIPYELYDWRFMIVLSAMLFVAISILAYVVSQQRLVSNYSEGVPLQKPFKQLLNVIWAQLILLFLLISVVIFYFSDRRYLSIKQGQVPYEFTTDTRVNNPTRNESYQLSENNLIYAYARFSGFRELVIERANDKFVVDLLKYDDFSLTRGVRGIKVHPNGQFLFLFSDSLIKIVDIDSLEVVSTVRLGGNIKDITLSPDGQTLYVLDALWNRVRVIPSPL